MGEEPTREISTSGGGDGGGALDHDNGEGVHATLEAAWTRTLNAWHGGAANGTGGEEEKEGLALVAVPSGAERRGEPPPWWNCGEKAPCGVLVVDGFLSADEGLADVRASFAGLYEVDDESAARVLAVGGKGYVMKPQREGGGDRKGQGLGCVCSGTLPFSFFGQVKIQEMGRI